MFMNRKPPRILVIILRYLGDTLLASPVFEALRFNYPHAFIAACVNEGTEAMLTDNPFIDKIFLVKRDQKRRFKDLRHQLRLFHDIRERRFDLTLELTHNDRGAFLGFISGASRRLGFFFPWEEKRFPDMHILYTETIIPEENTHIVDFNLRMVERLGLSVPQRIPRLYWQPQDEERAMKILAAAGISQTDSYVTLYPVCNTPFRSWNKEGYAALCDHLEQKWKTKTVLICGPAPKEMAFVNDIVSLCRSSRPVHLGGHFPLKSLAVAIHRAMLAISIDSGPMHIAAAVGTPVLAILGPQQRELWGPYGPDHVVAQKTWACVPCRRSGCDNDKQQMSLCLKELKKEEVLTILDEKMAALTKENKQLSDERQSGQGQLLLRESRPCP